MGSQRLSQWSTDERLVYNHTWGQSPINLVLEEVFTL